MATTTQPVEQTLEHPLPPQETMPTMYDLPAEDEFDDEVVEHPPSPQETMPTMYDLPDEEVDQPGMPDIFHVWQAQLLSETFRPPNYEWEEIFTASDLNIYYNPRDTRQNKRPDWFAVVGLPKAPEEQDMRLSYVMWQEGVPPLIVVELLSPSTQKADLGEVLRDPEKKPTKWDVYERWLRVSYYVTFSRYTDEMRVFQLSPRRYQEVKDHQGRFWIEDAQLGLGLWQGSYLNEERLWLRWYDRNGNWIPTKDELIARRNEQLAQQDEQLAQQDEQLAQQAEQLAQQDGQLAQQDGQLARLAAKLRELGIDPTQV